MEIGLLHRRDGLIISTIEVINDLGIQGVSIREIAKRQGISEATIFKHFKTKNELLMAVLDHYSQYDSDIILSIKMKQLTPIEAITYFINAYMEYYENYPAITAITQSYDFFTYNLVFADKIKAIFDSRLNFLKQLITEAILAGELSADVDAEVLSDIIWGSWRELCLRWRLKGYSFSLKEYGNTTIKTILLAFTPR